MRGLFFGVLNMSVTSCYVIAAVLLVRLLLRKAPKKYSYLLWSAAAFRLVCPISFASVVSVFNTGLFNMTKAQSGGETVLRYIPTDIGQPAAPGITVGIPAANAVISEHLPDFSGASGVNPIEAWITAGMVVWLAGLAALLVYSLLSYLRLRKRVATAVKLTDGVFEADGIRSPFVLGFLRPNIYIPFGLTEREKSYILRHEACHIERKDPIMKLAAFLILSLHWFNPLVWLAFTLMTKDMEMSCDERVLSASGDDIKRDYSASLLSLAAGRRFPDASPLAFGESVVKGRIQNILRFRKPRVWLTVLSAVLCAAVIVSCAANPKGSGEGAQSMHEPSPGASAIGTPEASPDSSRDAAAAVPDPAQPYGIYAFEQSIYASPASSFIPFKENMPTYIFTEDFFMTYSKEGHMTVTPVVYEQTDVDEASFADLFQGSATEGLGGGIFAVPDISKYSERTQFTLYEGGGSNQIYRLFHMDGEVWLATFMHIFELVPLEASSVDLSSAQSLSYQNLGVVVPLPTDYAGLVLPAGGRLDADVVLDAHYARGGLLFRIVRHSLAELEDYRAACGEAGVEAVHFATDMRYVYSCELPGDASPSPEYAAEYDALLAEVDSFILPGMIRENGLTAYEEAD